jgi:hypothetical protein
MTSVAELVDSVGRAVYMAPEPIQRDDGRRQLLYCFAALAIVGGAFYYGYVQLPNKKAEAEKSKGDGIRTQPVYKRDVRFTPSSVTI